MSKALATPLTKRERTRAEAALFRIGVAAMALSILPWLAIPALPLLEISNARRAVYAGALFASAEVIFWVGVALAGQETWRAVRRSGLRRAPGELWRLLRYGRRVAEVTGSTKTRAT